MKDILFLYILNILKKIHQIQIQLFNTVLENFGTSLDMGSQAIA